MEIVHFECCLQLIHLIKYIVRSEAECISEPTKIEQEPPETGETGSETAEKQLTDLRTNKGTVNLRAKL